MAVSQRQKTILKVKALLARAADRASTADEALKAASIAAKLMDEHRLSNADVDADTPGDAFYADFKIPFHWQWPIYVNITVRIAQFAGCYGYTELKANNQRVIIFYGDEGDVVFADWLLRSVGDFILLGCEEYVETSGKTGSDLNSRRKGYLLAAAIRINERLRDMIAEREARYAGSTVPALIDRTTQAKNALIKASNGGFNPAPMPPEEMTHADRDVIREGKARADRASFNSGIAGEGAKKRLSATT